MIVGGDAMRTTMIELNEKQEALHDMEGLVCDVVTGWQG
jgi:hypothetical protein